MVIQSIDQIQSLKHPRISEDLTGDAELDEDRRIRADDEHQ